MNKKGFPPKLRSFLQVRNRLLVIGLLLAFLMGACGNVPPTPLAESVIDEVQTAVAGTVSAQAPASATPTETSTPTVTPTPQVTFSPTPTATSHTSYYSTYYNYYDSEYVKDMTIPDGTVMSPGETFVKTWKFENTGAYKWTSDFLIVFVDGDDMDGSEDEIGKTVNVNKRAEISVSLTAPDDEGTYAGYWSLADEYGNTFGEWAYVKIVVSDDATNTPTPTSTATLTPTMTPTPTYTPVATDTLVPTPTSIGTSIVTDTPTPTSMPTATDMPVDTDTPIPTEVPTQEPTATPE